MEGKDKEQVQWSCPVASNELERFWVLRGGKSMLLKDRRWLTFQERVLSLEK